MVIRLVKCTNMDPRKWHYVQISAFINLCGFHLIPSCHHVHVVRHGMNIHVINLAKENVGRKCKNVFVFCHWAGHCQVSTQKFYFKNRSKTYQEKSWESVKVESCFRVDKSWSDTLPLIETIWGMYNQMQFFFYNRPIWKLISINK